MVHDEYEAGYYGDRDADRQVHDRPRSGSPSFAIDSTRRGSDDSVGASGQPLPKENGFSEEKKADEGQASRQNKRVSWGKKRYDGLDITSSNMDEIMPATSLSKPFSAETFEKAEDANNGGGAVGEGMVLKFPACISRHSSTLSSGEASLDPLEIQIPTKFNFDPEVSSLGMGWTSKPFIKFHGKQEDGSDNEGFKADNGMGENPRKDLKTELRRKSILKDRGSRDLDGSGRSRVSFSNGTADKSEDERRIRQSSASSSAHSFIAAAVNLDSSERQELVEVSAEAPSEDRCSTLTIPKVNPPQRLSRSTLVAANSTNDASWFASRGLMSQKSFKKFKKEMKKDVLKGSASMGMDKVKGETRNKTVMHSDPMVYDIKRHFDDSKGVADGASYGRSMSLGMGLDELDKSGHTVCSYATPWSEDDYAHVGGRAERWESQPGVNGSSQEKEADEVWASMPKQQVSRGGTCLGNLIDASVSMDEMPAKSTSQSTATKNIEEEGNDNDGDIEAGEGIMSEVPPRSSPRYSDDLSCSKASLDLIEVRVPANFDPKGEVSAFEMRHLPKPFLKAHGEHKDGSDIECVKEDNITSKDPGDDSKKETRRKSIFKDHGSRDLDGSERSRVSFSNMMADKSEDAERVWQLRSSLSAPSFITAIVDLDSSERQELGGTSEEAPSKDPCPGSTIPKIALIPRSSRSTLVAANSTNDASWFASRGLMSQKSFKKYKKEMKKKVLQRSASLGMDKVKGEARVYHIKRHCDDPEGDANQASYGRSMPLGMGPDELDKSSHTACSYSTARSDDDYVDVWNSAEHLMSHPQTANFRPPNTNARSPSLGAGLDRWAQSCMSSLEECDDEEEKNAAFASLLRSMLASPIKKKAGLTSDEVSVLSKMVKRLSSIPGDDDSDDSFVGNNPHESPREIFASEAWEGSVGSKSNGEMTGNQCQNQGPVDGDELQCQDEGTQRESKAECINEGVDEDSVQRDTCVRAVARSQDISPQSARTMLLGEKPAGGSIAKDWACPVEEQVFTASSEEPLNGGTCVIGPRTSEVADVDMPDAAENKGTESVGQEPRQRTISTGNVKSFNTEISSYVQKEQSTNASVGMSGRNSTNGAKFKIRPSNCAANKNLDGGFSDILTEGLNQLSVAMVVNIYGKLREMSILGHVSVKLVDIDVNSHQSLARRKEMKRLGLSKPEEESDLYLDNTKTAGFVVRAVLDEHEMMETSSQVSGALSQASDATMMYDSSLLRNFKAWVDESKLNQHGSGYFSKGSIMKNLIGTGLEVVWFQDRHPRDIIYCICVDKKSSAITVVFLGEENVFSRVRNSAMMEHRNPIASESYDGNAEFINLRAAVSEEILRPRKDTGKTTLDEIREKVVKIVKELADGGYERYHLSMVGHSLGGGLATVVGFYLASDGRLELASAIRVFTFASSRVGCRTFQQSFRHLEKTGRLLHARFTNSNDMVSLRPFWDLNGSWKYDDWYQHVGMHINFYENSAQSLEVNYDEDSGLVGELFDLIKSYLFGKPKKSRLSEYQRRMHCSREYWITKNNDTDRLGNKVRGLLSLDELYAMEGNLNNEIAEAKYSSSHIYIVVAFFLSLEVFLLFRMASNFI